MEQKTNNYDRCVACGNEINVDVCWCGDLYNHHVYPMDAGHSFVPLGCSCGFDHTVTSIQMGDAGGAPAPATKTEKLEKLTQLTGDPRTTGVPAELGQVGFIKNTNEVFRKFGPKDTDWMLSRYTIDHETRSIRMFDVDYVPRKEGSKPELPKVLGIKKHKKRKGKFDWF